MSRQTRRQSIFVGVFLLIVIVFVLTFRLGAVRGVSMSPTYEEGQAVLVLRRTLFRPALQRGDVVLVQHGRDVLIKRIYRLPGEEIDGRVSFFLKFSDTYDLSDYYEQVPGKNKGETRLVVPKDYVVVLGDNARASEDSRMFGPVPIRDILGTVVNAPPPPATEEPMAPPPSRPRLTIPNDIPQPPKRPNSG
jgi:signal peptidase I